MTWFERIFRRHKKAGRWDLIEAMLAELETNGAALRKVADMADAQAMEPIRHVEYEPIDLTQYVSPDEHPGCRCMPLWVDWTPLGSLEVTLAFAWDDTQTVAHPDGGTDADACRDFALTLWEIEQLPEVK
jgi:hypothetical protein